MIYPKKNIMAIVFLVYKILFIIIMYNVQNIKTFFVALFILTFIFIMEIIYTILKKYNMTFTIGTIFLFFLILPILTLGNELGPTFGNDIKYNNILWKQSINNNIKYYMAKDIIKIITENKFEKEDILKMLGEPDFESANNFIYFLKNNNLVIGMDAYFLLLEFVDDKCVKANIIRED
jgi:hypothetical protein